MKIQLRNLPRIVSCVCLLAAQGVIAKYILDVDGAADFTRVVGFAHGWLYVLYLVFAFDLGSKAKWPVGKQLWVLLAGTIPTAAFFVERKISHELEAKFTEGSPAVAKV